VRSGSSRGGRASSSEERVEALVDLANRDVLLLSDLSRRYSVVSRSGNTHCDSTLPSISLERADDVLTDGRVYGLVANIELVVAKVHITDIALSEGWGRGSQHHGQHRSQQHYLPQTITSLTEGTFVANPILSSLCSRVNTIQHHILSSLAFFGVCLGFLQPVHITQNL
jgi:hypothetical protein